MTDHIAPADIPRPEALLALRGAGQMPVGRDRIAMLDAVNNRLPAPTLLAPALLGR